MKKIFFPIFIYFIFLMENTFAQSKNPTQKNNNELQQLPKKDSKEKSEDPDDLLKRYAENPVQGKNKFTGLGGFLTEEFKPKFIIGGFMDIQYSKSYPDKPNKNSLEHRLGIREIGGLGNENIAYPTFTANPAFKIANINLYNTFHITDSWKAFAEFRFLFAPSGQRVRSDDVSIVNGIPVNQNGQPIIGKDPVSGTTLTGDNMLKSSNGNTFTLDSQSTNLNYGSIFIERAYIENNKSEKYSFRVGRFFTPIGIWSQDHGAPILTSIKLPLFVNNPFLFAGYGIPIWETGAQMFGKFFLPKDIIMNYAVMVGNGVNNDPTRSDDDKNKSIGGHLNFKIFPTDNIDFDFGSSGYRGDRTVVDYYFNRTLQIPVTINLIKLAMSQSTVVNPGQNYTPSNVASFPIMYDPSRNSYTLSQNDTFGAAHFKISIRKLPLDGKFIVQGEGYRQFTVEYSRKQDISKTGELVLMRGVNFTSNNFYLQFEYQFFGLISPYCRFEQLTSNRPTISISPVMETYVYGINFKPNPKIAMKVEYVRNLTRGSEVLVEMATIGASISAAF